MNKSKIKILQIMTLAIGVFSLSACLNDETPNNLINGAKSSYSNQSFVEVHLTSGDNSNIIAYSFKASDVSDTVKLIPVNLTHPATSDVTISFELITSASSTLMDSLETKDGFTAADPSIFTIENSGSKVTIPAGKSTGYIQVKFNPSNFQRSAYILGVHLTSVSGDGFQLSNLSYGYVKYIKNLLDGRYSCTGSMVDYVSSSLTGYYPANVDLVAQDGFSVAYFDEDLVGFGHLIVSNGTSLSYYGSFAPVFKLDGDNNVISVRNYYVQPVNTRAAEIDPSGVNKYDPATKTLKVSYWMNQPSVVVTPPYHRTHFDETFTYVGPR